jgi:hypothetical protein
MTIRILMSLALMVSLSACESMAEPNAIDGEQYILACDNLGSRGDPKKRPVNIHFQAGEITASPDPICARPGDLLQFNLNGTGVKRVSVVGKKFEDRWIFGAGKSGFFYVVVPYDLIPEGSEVEKTFFYTIYVGDEKKDPEVRVRN